MDGVPQQEDLRALVHYQMPFGKYAGVRLIDLPEAYLSWWQRSGWPDGRLGVLLQLTFEIRINGLRYLIDRLAELEGNENDT